MFNNFQTNYKQAGDENLLVAFYPKSIFNRQESEKEETPVYNNIDYVKIIQRGTAKELIDRRVKDEDKLRFEGQWTAYQNNKTQELDGIPIETLPLIQPNEVSMCKHLKIYTIEHLANMVDSSIIKLGLNGRALVNRAKKFLAGSGTRVVEELQECKDIIKELQEQIKVLQTKRTRKRKVVKDDPIDDSTKSIEADSLI